jgi:hypothetical protein
MIKISIIQYLLLVDHWKLFLYMLPIASLSCLLKVSVLFKHSINKNYSKNRKLLHALNIIFAFALLIGACKYFSSSELPNKERLFKERKTHYKNIDSNYLF